MWHTYVVGRDQSAHKVLHVKIGRSRNPVKRINHLQTFSPVPLKALFILEGDRERELHQRFAQYRTSGEWFRVSGELKEFILKHTKRTAHYPTFHVWLMNQRQRRDDIGRLAVVIKSDLEFPHTRRKLHPMLEYMRLRHPHLLGLFKLAHKTYRDETLR